MWNYAAQPVATSIAGEAILYVVCPLLVAGILAVVTFMSRLSRRVTTVEHGQTDVMREILPENKPSMRDLITDVRSGQSEQTAQANLIAADLKAYKTLVDERYFGRTPAPHLRD